MFIESDGGLLTFAPEGASVGGSTLTAADFDRFTQIVGCGTQAHARAVFEVEANGSGFTTHAGARVPKILFEAHIFYQLSEAYPVSRVAPHLSSRSWNRGLYGRTGRPVQRGENVQHVRLSEAVALDAHFNANGAIRNAALMSCSWGIGQVLARNWRSLGYPSLQAFINAMFESEGAQLDAVARFVKTNGIADELCRGDWAGFARRYNGPAYRQNAYDTKLAQAYRRHGGR